VRTLHDGPLVAWTVRVRWDGRHDRGRAVPPGLYLVRATAGPRRAVVRVVLLR
jgi:hypothetical protein